MFVSRVVTTLLYFCTDNAPPRTKFYFNQLNFVVMENIIKDERQIIRFVSEREFTLFDKHYAVRMPYIELDYFRVKNGSEPVLMDMEFHGNPAVHFENAQKNGELFLKYAHRLYEKRNVILSDSRLYNAAIPLGSTTLGEYLLWWKNYKCSRVVDADGELQLIYAIRCGRFEKNPGCIYIDKQGRSFLVNVTTSPWDAMRSLDEAKALASGMKDFHYGTIQTYTIADVVTILFGADM